MSSRHGVVDGRGKTISATRSIGQRNGYIFSGRSWNSLWNRGKCIRMRATRSCQRNELPSTMCCVSLLARAGFRAKTSPIAIWRACSSWKKNESLGRYVRQHFLSSSARFSADVFMTRDWKRRYALEYAYTYIFSSLSRGFVIVF